MRAVQDTTMDIAVWLRGLGLQRYEALFRENDIDAEVLSDLTDGDLEKIGVSLGHRKRLLKAAAALTGPAAPLAAATRSRQSPTPPSVANSPSCFAISSARPRCRPGWIPRTCARSFASIRTPVRARSHAMTASSPNSWAMACWPILAFLALTRRTPSVRSGPASTSRPSLQSSKRGRMKILRSASASPPGSS